MPYGILKVDTITFTAGGVDTSVSISGLVQNPTFTGGITSTGTISGNIIQGGTTVSGATVTGTAGQFGTLTGNTAGFTTVTGATVTGTVAQFTTITGGTAGFTTVTGTTVTGTTANFATLSGATVTGNAGSFTTVTGGVATITSGVFAAGTAALPSISISSDPNTGIFSPGADQLAISTGGSGRLFVDASGNVGVGTAPSYALHVLASATSVAAFKNSSAVNTQVLVGNTAADTIIRTLSTGDGFLFSDTGKYLAFGSNGAIERLRIRSDGTVEIKGGGVAGTSPAFSVNPSASANSLVIDSSGRLGVGTSSPDSTLNVRAGANNTAAEEIASFSRPDAAVRAAISKGLISGTTNGIALGTTTNHPFALNTNGSERLYITNAGNVGIGTSSPATALQVNGDIRAVGAAGTGYELNDANTKISIPAANSIAFSTSGLERVRINNTGNVGIGTTSPAELLHCQKLGQLALRLTDTTTANTDGSVLFSNGTLILDSRFNSGNGIIRFGGNNTTQEYGRFDTSGRLLVGTSNARSNFYNTTATSAFQVEGTTNDTGAISIIANTNATANAPHLIFAKSAGTSVGSNIRVDPDTNLGRLTFQGSDGTEFVAAAEIRADSDGGTAANDMPGRLVFSTTPDNQSPVTGPVERMRITNGGAMLQGNTADLAGVLGTGLKVKSNEVGSSFSAAALCLQGTGGDFYAVKFADQDMGILSVTSGAIDAIQIGGSVTTASLYSNGLVQLPNVGTTASAANVFMDSTLGNQLARSTSSLRYKTDIEDLDTDRADAALSLRPVWYRSKATADRKDWSHYGLIAEEVAEIEPRLVNWTYLEDEYITVTNEYGIESKELKPNAKLVPDGVQYERLSVLLLSVIQRQEKRIEYLEAEIATLKAQLS